MGAYWVKLHFLQAPPTAMPRIKLNGIPVTLPFDPYPPQIVTMTKLIECFQTGTHSLIESPTGTGKSLSILCSALAYYEIERRTFSEEKKPFKIFVCSRTHKQIEQLIEQLRKTEYRPRITVLGSKAQYCINPLISREADKNTACLDLLNRKNCKYFNKKDVLMKRMGDRIFDIEELKEEGRTCGGCPYYAARGMQEDADLIFAPYNYLIDTSVRESSEINLKNAILIIDEAHNIEDCCRSAGSVEITHRLVELVASELFGAMKKSALTPVQQEFAQLQTVFKKLAENAEKTKTEVLKRGKDVVAVLEAMGIGKTMFMAYRNALQAIAKEEDAKAFLSLNTTRFLQELERVLGLVLYRESESYAYCFTRYADERDYSYNLWLLDPSVMFLPLVSSVRSVSLLSGTLTPFNSFCSELKFQFQHRVIAPHIIRKEQVFIANIRKGHLGQDLCGIYRVTETPGYLEQVARIVVDISRNVKGGTLVFVPSYSFLNKLGAKVPGVILEPKVSTEFESAMEKYRQRILQKKDAVFLCVYRGKASEGIDFKDEYARAVVAVGIPYPSIKDPQIGLKKEYNDKNGVYNGRQWYEAQAYRAVNQALGRAIRHSKDWGAVYLVDSRYSEKRYQGALPGWISSGLKIYETYNQSLKPLIAFVKSNTEEVKVKDVTVNEENKFV